ncbi:TMV resistance protein N-like [Neltuma alba]|uniref:TMV resistance protein N-like n=1 Tax=Neltuma alba TaxID=207710 RepID=UPI0010A2EC67|nr:TMV resistance protein N-like [Prosopis alba]
MKLETAITTIAPVFQKVLLIVLGVLISKAIKLISHWRNGNQPAAIDASSEDDVVLTHTDSPPATKYDVFLSFRGEDTRHNFGNPSSIRKQNGNFGKGFDILKQRFKDNQQKLQKWRNVIIQSTSLSGWDSNVIRPEFKLVEEIVKDILSKLNRKSSIYVEGLVGIDHQIRRVEELISEARIVGIWGMGGIGKTTLARAVFDKLKAHFEAFCFIKNVRQKLAERNGLDELQEKCLKELLKDDDINAYDLRSDFVRKRLQCKKILLILDDVDNSIAIEDLKKACDWFGEGSRVIITSRDRHVLEDDSVSASATYHVLKLDPHHALHLFSLNAFNQNEPLKCYLELSKWVVDYCQGNPLALKVLGRFLHGRGKEEWESALAKLNQTPHNDIFNVLKLSFDGLDDIQKNAFLDLAFLLNAGWRISQDYARHLYGSIANIEINILEERSLISVDDGIEMHALLIDMGLEISKQQLKSNPDNPIRLWRHEDIYRYFSNNDKGIEAIRCMSLDASQIESMTLRASHFQRMRYLMFLNVYKSDQRNPSKLNICEELDYLSKELRFLSWQEYPLPSVPLQFCAKNLIELNMPRSNIQQLWDGNQQFPNLKKIYLWNSKNLMALPDLSQAPKIEWMSLGGCVNLDQIHSSTVLEKDVNLFIKDCGPMQINIGGSVKRRSSSRLVIVYNYLDVSNLTFNKVTMKVLVCGKMMCGVGFKHVRMPLGETAEFMRVGIQSLATLLPFVRVVEWLESPIEFGHDFKQHHTYHVCRAYTGLSSWNDFRLSVKVRGDGEERGVEDDEEEDEDDTK